jgi:hypothetical protein
MRVGSGSTMAEGSGVGVGGSGVNVGGTGVDVGGSAVGGSGVGGDASGVAVARLGVACCGAEQANIDAAIRDADRSNSVLFCLIMIILLIRFTVTGQTRGPTGRYNLTTPPILVQTRPESTPLRARVLKGV